MSSLSSSSTLAQVWAAYEDNASYEEDLSTTKAKAFITACRILLRRTPSSQTKGSNQVNYDPGHIAKELEHAKVWLEARDPDYRVGPDSVRPDFRNFRG